eukprot:TRINITY_DN618_c0_g2_i3.p1 TRINITY_DN618_c0_g2~~TRINITY_DN618_c0_g2_i3.p1  ORF type:complete len:335 (+),score=63.88 TRINITY_DN618_c0_g2_i3:84-1088(+)
MAALHNTDRLLDGEGHGEWWQQHVARQSAALAPSASAADLEVDAAPPKAVSLGDLENLPLSSEYTHRQLLEPRWRYQYLAYALSGMALASWARLQLWQEDHGQTLVSVPWADALWVLLSFAIGAEVVYYLSALGGFAAGLQDLWWLLDVAFVVILQLSFGLMASPVPVLSVPSGTMLQRCMLNALAVRFGCRSAQAMVSIWLQRRGPGKRQVAFTNMDASSKRYQQHRGAARGGKSTAPAATSAERSSKSAGTAADHSLILVGSSPPFQKAGSAKQPRAAGRSRSASSTTHTLIDVEAESESEEEVDTEWVCIDCGLVNQDIMTHCLSCRSVRM